MWQRLLYLLLTTVLVIACATACGRVEPQSSRPDPSAQPAPSPPPATPLQANPAPNSTPLPDPGAVIPPDLTATAAAPTWPTVPLPSPTPQFSPPMPAVPLEQALPQFQHNTLLFVVDQRFLMLANEDLTRQLWLTAQICAQEPSRLLSTARWSPDGRFIALRCHDDHMNTQGALNQIAYILDCRSGAVKEVARGSAVTYAWSPNSSRLLVNELSEGRVNRSAIVDAASDTTTNLAVAARWGSMASRTMGVYGAFMAWSPDGATIALLGDDGQSLYLVDADGTNLRRLKQVEETAEYVRLDGALRWSDDGRLLAVTRFVRLRGPQTNPDPQPIQIAIQTGEIQSPPQAEQFALSVWSPDKQWYVDRMSDDTQRWAIYRADHTLLRALPATGSVPAPSWTADSQEVVLFKELTPAPQIAVVAIDLAGVERTLFVGTANEVVHTSWDRALLSPDSTLLALVVEEPGTDTYQVRIVTRQGQQSAVLSIPAQVEVLGWRPGIASTSQ